MKLLPWARVQNNSMLCAFLLWFHVLSWTNRATTAVGGHQASSYICLHELHQISIHCLVFVELETYRTPKKL